MSVNTLRLADPPEPTASPTPPDGPAADPLLVDAVQLGRLLSLSAVTVRRMDSAGKLPRALRLSRGCCRWRRTEIEEWLRAGAPDRRTWEALQAKKGRP